MFRVVSRRLAVAFMLAAVALCLAGCVFSFIEDERSNRGGFADALMDRHWMAADTNQMRTLRAYLLIGSIARLRKEGYYKTERQTLVTAMNSAILAASEVYACAYSAPGRCVFFDERMVELEANLLRLLAVTISTEENQDLASILNREIGKSVPGWKAVESIGKFADAMTSTLELAAQSGTVVLSLVKFGEVGLTYGRRIGALYRDMLELEMITVLHSLDTMCAVASNSFTEYHVDGGYYSHETFQEKASAKAWISKEGWAFGQFYGRPPQGKDACRLFGIGHEKWSRGAGDLKAWRAFLDIDVKPMRPWIVPDENAFIQASDLIWRVCETVSGGASTDLSRCLGRVSRPGDVDGKKEDAAKRECHVNYAEDGSEEKVDNKPADTKQPEGDKNSEKKAADQAKAKIWNDRCRLILFWQTWERRQNQMGRANARIDWLSNFAPSVGHPVETRGWARTPAAPPPKEEKAWIATSAGKR